MMTERYITILGMAICMTAGHAQTVLTNMDDESLDSFRMTVRKDFNHFRQQAMADFINFARNPWKEFEESAPIPRPKEKPIPPVIMPKEDESKPIEDKPVIIKEVVKPIPIEPQPNPIEPIDDVPVPYVPSFEFSFFGTSAEVRFDIDKRPKLKGIGSNDIANSLQGMESGDYDNLIIDCLNLRKNLQLSDWAYLYMLKQLSAKISGEGTNESVLLMAYLYLQSGYQMRLANDGKKLYMLFS
ncbi:MAG: hypothetical protein ACI35P_15650, partial [Bacillus sp. (in: firmicutes)]